MHIQSIDNGISDHCIRTFFDKINERLWWRWWWWSIHTFVYPSIRVHNMIQYLYGVVFVCVWIVWMAYLKCCSGLVRDLWHSTIIAHRNKQIFCNRRRSHFHSPHILHRFSCADSQFIHIKISIWCYLILILHYIFIWFITSTDADNDNKVCLNKH